MGCGRWSVIGLLAVIGAFEMGCRHTDKHDVEVPLVEEFRQPPHENRFDNPPEQGYKKPPPKKEFKPGFGGPNGPGASGGGSMNR